MDYTLFRGGRHPNSESGATPASKADRDLASLRWHWGSAYEIWHGAPAPSESLDLWMAQRRSDPRALLVAMSAGELRQMIRTDYRESRRPSPLVPSL